MEPTSMYPKSQKTPSQHREGVFFDILIICWKLQGGHERHWKHHFESILNKLVKCGTKYNLSEDLGAPSWYWEGFSQNFKQILEALGRPWEAWEKTFKIWNKLQYVQNDRKHPLNTKRVFSKFWSIFSKALKRPRDGLGDCWERH